MTSKLYKVTITQIFGVLRADISEYWIAASSPAQAKRRGLSYACLSNRPERVHVRVDNYRGGVQHIRNTTLRAAA